MTTTYVFETTYIIEAPDEAKARETVDNVESTLGPDQQVVEHFTRLIDVGRRKERPYGKA